MPDQWSLVISGSSTGHDHHFCSEILTKTMQSFVTCLSNKKSVSQAQIYFIIIIYQYVANLPLPALKWTIHGLFLPIFGLFKHKYNFTKNPCDKLTIQTVVLWFKLSYTSLTSHAWTTGPWLPHCFINNIVHLENLKSSVGLQLLQKRD